MSLSLPYTVLMTADTVGGVWTYALELTRALEKFGVQVHLATMGQKMNRNQRKTAREIPNLEVSESAFALEWMEEPWKDVEAAGEWLMELEQQIHPDIVHLNNYVHGALPWKAPVVIAGHSCVLSWWQAVKKEEAPPSWKTYARRVREGLQSADHVVGVTHYMLDRLRRYYGPFSSAGVIYNARSSEAFTSAHPKKEVLFSMGRLWDEAKNIQALQAISSSLPWAVNIAGEDKGKLSTNGSAINVLGCLKEADIARWLARTSIYVMPARYEPFGLSILEAALSGCALVLGDVPSLREVWSDAAVYVNPDDSEQLKQEIQTLIEDADKRRRMADKAHSRAARYSFDRFAHQYAKVYQRLLQAEKASLA